VVLLQ
jgi:hypothetical protein